MKTRARTTAWLLTLLIWIPEAFAMEFSPCADAGASPALDGSWCAHVAVPADHAGRDAGQLSLFIRKFPATGASKGSVWAIAGGPGESGASLYPFVAVLRRSFPGFDLFIPDHRGTGRSSRLCPEEESEASPGGTALAGAEWGSCFGRLQAHPQPAGQFTITNAAHDLRQLVRQLQPANGKPVYLYGVSYGTQLILRALQPGPLPVSGLVLDSLVPVDTDARWDLSRRSQVVDEVGRQVLAQCDADASCAAAMGEPLERIYRRVLANLAAKPALLARVPGKDLRQFLGTLLDMPPLRARIPFLIRDLDRGQARELDAVRAGLSALQATLGDAASMPPSIPLVGIISKSENDLRPGREMTALRQEEAPLLFTSPLPALLADSTLPAYARDAYFGKHPVQLPPTLVLQGRLDPKTPFQGARKHADTLREHGPLGLVAVGGAPHFILWTAPGCFQRHVAAFVAGDKPIDAECMMF